MEGFCSGGAGVVTGASAWSCAGEPTGVCSGKAGEVCGGSAAAGGASPGLAAEREERGSCGHDSSVDRGLNPLAAPGRGLGCRPSLAEAVSCLPQ